jgi:hypothetical protein
MVNWVFRQTTLPLSGYLLKNSLTSGCNVCILNSVPAQLQKVRRNIFSMLFVTGRESSGTR